MPSAITEFRAGSYLQSAHDFTVDPNATSVRVMAQVGTVGFASAAIGFQWRELSNGSWWGVASGGTGAAWCAIGSGGVATPLGAAPKVGTWFPINPSMRAAGLVALRPVGRLGNGAIDPTFNSIQLFIL